jgi:serine/threonine-protein kinase
VLLATQDGKSRLFLRDIASAGAVPISGTEDAWQPSFSPDGRGLVFFAERKLKKVSLDGGPAVALAEIEGNPRGASWGADGRIVVAPSQYEGLSLVDVNGSAPKPLTQLDLARGESSHRWPQILPGGQSVLFTVGIEDSSYDDARLEVVSLDTGERRPVLDGGACGRYSGGRLFFVNAGRVLTVPFDLQNLAVRGTPEVVLEGIHYDRRNGAMHFAVSDSGNLVYGPAAPSSRESYLAWIDAGANLTRIENTPRQFQEPSLSPDGHRVAARIGSDAESDLWIIDTRSATPLRLSFGLSPHRPTWTHDGRGITVAAEEKGRFKLLTFSATGAGPPVNVFESSHRLYPTAWSGGGRALVFQERRPETGWDLRVLPVGPDGRAAGPPRDLAATRFHERNAALSPDGRFFAYESDEADGVMDVYVARFDDPGGKVRATGFHALWPRFGVRGQLYYWYPTGARPRARPLDSPVAEGLHRVDLREEAPSFGVARSAALWAQTPPTRALLSRLVVGPFSAYDIDRASASPRFLVLERSAPVAEPLLHSPAVVLNWFEDLTAHAGQRPR